MFLVKIEEVEYLEVWEFLISSERVKPEIPEKGVLGQGSSWFLIIFFGQVASG